MRFDMFQSLLKRPDAVRLRNEIGMQWDAHDRAAFFTLFQQLVEMAFEHIGIARWGLAKRAIGNDVIHFERIGKRDKLAGFRFQGLRLIILEKVTGIPEIIFRNQIDGLFCMGERWRQITANALPGLLFNGVDTVFEDRALLGFAHAIGIAGIVNAVREELPVPLDAVFDDLRMVIEKRDIERDRPAQLIFVE